MRTHEIACDRMRSHAIACDLMRSNEIAVEFNPPGERDNTRSHAIPCDLMRSHEIACDRMRSHVIACDRMKSQTLCRQLSEFLKMHREREAGQKVCLKCFFTTTVNRFHYYFFRLSQKGRNEKRESFYTAKRVSSVHSRRDETRLAVFSVPFPQNKFQTCFFQVYESISLVFIIGHDALVCVCQCA